MAARKRAAQAKRFDRGVVCEDAMKILVTGCSAGTANARVALALAVLGAEVVTVEAFEIKRLELAGMWRDPAIALERQRSYGPPVKGCGGKVKRW